MEDNERCRNAEENSKDEVEEEEEEDVLSSFPMMKSLLMEEGSHDSEVDAIRLLQEIFPNASVKELEDMHSKRIRKRNTNVNHDVNVSKSDKKERESIVEGLRKKNVAIPVMQLPSEFLRIPKEHALPVFDPSKQLKEWRLVRDLQAAVTQHFQSHMTHLQMDFHQHLATATATEDSDSAFTDFTRVVSRQPKVGFGITLMEYAHFIFVQAVVSNDATQVYSHSDYQTLRRQHPQTTHTLWQSFGPAARQGIQPHDLLLGINGIPLHPHQQLIQTRQPQQTSFLQNVGTYLQASQHPVLFHIRRYRNHHLLHPSAQPSLHTHTHADTSHSNSFANSPIFHDHFSLPPSSPQHPLTHQSPLNQPLPENHPLFIALSKRQLINASSTQDEHNLLILLQQYKQRTTQWEATNQLRITASKPHRLLHHIQPHHHNPSLPYYSSPNDDAKYHPADLQYSALLTSSLNNYTYNSPKKTTIQNRQPANATTAESANIRINGSLHANQSSSLNIQLPSSPVKYRHDQISPRKSFFRSSSPKKKLSNDIVINMLPVRKGLCIRILNSFLDMNQIAYTVWVLDIESGKEWYAPIRYYEDFKDLRSATMQFAESVSQIPFPIDRWFNEKSISGSAREQRCLQLENFIRALAGLVYTGPLHPNIVEVSIHLQSFLGCDTCIGDQNDAYLSLHDQVATINRSFNLHEFEMQDQEVQRLKIKLKRSFQLYIYRIFLLPVFQGFINQFISNVKSTSLTIEQMRILDLKSSTTLKDQVQKDLEKIQAFLDHLTDLLYEGCSDDLMTMAKSSTFATLNDEKKVGNVTIFLDSNIRESIREQVETEVYVPLRSYLSKQLVNGWRHDDMEINFKLQVLKNRPQSYYNIHPHHQSPSNWKNAVMILKEGVGLSTLPITKLHAIVLAAKEIAVLHEREHKSNSECKNPKENDAMEGKTAESYLSLGADEFLPIFIYCIVQAGIERPCALCILLRTLCDSSMEIGETGYYLSSFEASIAHVKEINLMLENDQ